MEGYNKYSKLGKPFLSPQVTWKPEVIIPPEHVRWMVDQPDSVFSIHKVLIDDLRFDYTSPRAWDFDRAFHVEALNKMNLDAMTADMMDEIDFRTAAAFGATPNRWHTTTLQSSLFDILLAVTNRAFAGKRLARSPAYSTTVASFIALLPRRASLIDALCPTLLKPLLAPHLAAPLRRLTARYEARLLPRIAASLSAATATETTTTTTTNPPNPSTTTANERTADVIALLARAAAKSPSPRDRSPHSLAARLLALNFVAVHTSYLTAVAALSDILTRGGPSLWAELRSEAADALRATATGSAVDSSSSSSSSFDARWTKAAVGRLVLLDSALRESMRVSPFKGRGVEREVVAEGGVVMPGGSGSVRLPRGTKVGVATAGVHGDGRFYERPGEFVPGRFVGRAGEGLVNVSERWLGFGVGRHACPGRFFSAHELKLLVAHLVLNYDFEVVGGGGGEGMEKKPGGPVWVTDFHLFAEPYVVRARRRERSAHLDQ
ncbi:cytochrome p450 [Diplodia corticola]|uniref:Cytochrome p450 n=1 Tax=Diplodia corticola TaxID=236234 RepID=A0A1J9QNM5_9PEZI|nr:cytochrome p450 [Diplodia corticola]OJD30510.1 cytochrome p450 [Diplodia corticola]